MGQQSSFIRGCCVAAFIGIFLFSGIGHCAIKYKKRHNPETGRGDWVINVTESELCQSDGTDCPAGIGGDITDVFDCASGDCNTITVETGESLSIAPGGEIAATETVLSFNNDSGATLYACTAVYLSAFDVPSDLPEVLIADADDAAKMPVVGLVENDTVNGANGILIIHGTHENWDTATGEGWSVGDALYVNDSGTSASEDCGNTLTNVRPANIDDGVQKIGEVVRVHPTKGQIEITGAGRANDVPNLESAKLWVGNGSNVATPVLMSGDASMSNTGVVTIDHGNLDGLADDDHSAYENELNNSAGLRAALDDEDGSGTCGTDLFCIGGHTHPTSQVDDLSGTNTGDMSNADVKTAYEANANTNAYTDSEKTVVGNTSGTNTGDVAEINNLETVTTGIALNEVPIGTATDDSTYKLLPSCSNATTSKLLYNNSTQVFSCGTDQSSAGAPTDADYLVGTANGGLSAEIVVGTSPQGELGGTWASPTIDDGLTVDSWTFTTAFGNFDGGVLELPQDDTTDAVGECQLDTTDFTFVCHDGTANRMMGDDIIQTTFTVYSDGTWDNETVPIWIAPKDYAITIVQVHAATMGTTPSLAYNIEERAKASLASSGTDIYASDQAADATGEDETSFSNAGIAAGAHLVFTTGTSAETGTVDLITGVIYYRRNVE